MQQNAVLTQLGSMTVTVSLPQLSQRTPHHAAALASEVVQVWQARRTVHVAVLVT